MPRQARTPQPPPAEPEIDVPEELRALFEWVHAQASSPAFDPEALRPALGDLHRLGKQGPQASFEFLDALAASCPGHPSSCLQACAGMLLCGAGTALGLRSHFELSGSYDNVDDFWEADLHYDPKRLVAEAADRLGHGGLGLPAAELLTMFFTDMVRACWTETSCLCGSKEDFERAASLFMAHMEARLFAPGMSSAFPLQHDLASSGAMLAAATALATRAGLESSTPEAAAKMPACPRAL